MKERLRLPALAAVLSKPINPFSELVVRQLSTWQKMVYGFAAALLVLLGLLGLVLPVLPGLVFLAMAAGLLARGFPRGLVGGGIKRRSCSDFVENSNNLNRLGLEFGGDPSGAA